MSRIALLSVLLSVPAFVACSAPADPNATSTVTGTIALSAYQGIDNPVVISRSPSGRVFVAPVQVTGAFRLDLPSNESYRFVLASTRADRSYVGLSEIHWAGGTVWGKFPKPGTAMNLGVVRPVGSNASAPAGDVTVQDHGGDTYSGSGGSTSGGSGSGGGETSSGSGGGSYSGGSGSGSETSGSGAASDSSGSTSTCKVPGEAKLPYDVKPQLGQTFRLTDAFLLEGPLPASVVSVTMDGGSWRLTELQANTPFTITQDDCNHQGNRDVGRDRVFITWTNAGGGQQTDHLDLRYCEAGGRVPDDAATAPPPAPSSGECSSTQAPLCKNGSSAMPESECTGDHLDSDDHDYSYGGGGITTSDYGSDDKSGGDKSHCDDDVPQCPAGAGGAGGAGTAGGSSSGSTAGTPAGDATGGGAAGGSSTGGTATGGTATGGAGAGGAAGGSSTGGTATGGSATGGAGAGGAAAGAPGSATAGSVTSGGTATSAGSVPAGGSCVVNADCQAGLSCFASTCRNVIR